MFSSFTASSLIAAVESHDLRLKDGFLSLNFCHHPWVTLAALKDMFSFSSTCLSIAVKTCPQVLP